MPSKPSDPVKRFDLHFRIQHIILFTSVTLLVATGIPMWCLRLPANATAARIIDWFGGIEAVRPWHHGAAIALIFACAYHILYILVHPTGRRDFVLMLPAVKDFQDLFHNVAYYLGLRPEGPLFGRFSYWEKFDYWAAFWGCVILIGTGLVMWFPDQALAWLPATARYTAYEMAKEAHADEALLAALALYIWHFYNVHFRPGRFPGTLLWLHGNMSRQESREEHPLEFDELSRMEQQ